VSATPPAESPTMTTISLLAIICAGGFLGGTIDLLHKLTYKDHKFYLYDHPYSRGTFFLLILRSGFVGIGGARGLAAVRIYADEFKNDLGAIPRDVIYNFALSVIAGFASRTLLPNIANMLDRRLKEQDEKIAEQGTAVAQQSSVIEQTQEQLETQKDELEQQRHELENRKQQHEMAEAIMLGGFALGPAAVKSEIEHAKQGLIELLDKVPKARRAAIYLARIRHEKDKDFDGAIAALSDFLEKNEDTDTPTVDIADVLYNKACYLALKAAHLQTEGAASEAIEDLRKEAVLALERSISLLPANADDAAGDQDLSSLRELEPFQRLIKYV
jgi:hypothetical protein